MNWNGTDRRLLEAQKRADEQKWTRRREDALQEKLDAATAERDALAVDDLEFRLRMARLLSELNGEAVLSEQQCAKYMRFDLASWRRLSHSFAAGACFVEGEEAELPEQGVQEALAKAIKSQIGNAEQSAFEDWIARQCPSGDVTELRHQWGWAHSALASIKQEAK